MNSLPFPKPINLRHAIRLLEACPTSRQELLLLSQLYRHHGMIIQEGQLVDRALSFSPDWEEMQQRKAWHEAPLFDRAFDRDHASEQRWGRLAARPPFQASNAPQDIPTDLCFVTAGGSDAPYFMLLLGLLESLKASRYRHVPIGILDAGLTPDDIDYLHRQYDNLTILDPGWDYTVAEFPRGNPNALKGLTARNWIAKHFPGYRYYFWMDTDIWIQDDRIIDRMIALTMQQGLAIPGIDNLTDEMLERCRMMTTPFTKPDDFIETFQRRRIDTVACFFCVDHSSGFFSFWTECVERLVAANDGRYHWMMDEMSLLHAFSTFRDDLQLIEGTFSPFDYVLPRVWDGLLYYPHKDEVIGAVHLTSWKILKENLMYPMRISPTPLVGQELQDNRNYWADLAYIYDRKQTLRYEKAPEGYAWTSLHYFVLPAEKQDLRPLMHELGLQHRLDHAAKQISQRADAWVQSIRPSQDATLQQAKAALKQGPLDGRGMHQLSLLYRYFHQYEEEAQLIARALLEDPYDPYMADRKAWHTRDLFHLLPEKSRVVPRKPIPRLLPYQSVVSQEILEQLCIVTAAGSREPFFGLAVELLESIEATHYKDIPLYIIDTGMEDPHKEALLKRFGTIRAIHDPDWQMDEGLVFRASLEADTDDGNDLVKFESMRPYLPRIFPGHRYYLYLDADTWIQDVDQVDALVLKAVQQGIAATHDFSARFDRANHYAQQVLPQYKTPEVLAYPSVNAGIFAMDARSSFATQWATIMEEHFRANGFSFGGFTIQMSLNLVFALNRLELMPYQETQYIFTQYTGSPVLQHGVLYNQDAKRVGIVHLTTYAKRNNRFWRPLLSAPDRRKGKAIEEAVMNQYLPQEEGIVFGSVSFRQYPEEDVLPLLGMI